MFTLFQRKPNGEDMKRLRFRALQIQSMEQFEVMIARASTPARRHAMRTLMMPMLRDDIRCCAADEGHKHTVGCPIAMALDRRSWTGWEYGLIDGPLPTVDLAEPPPYLFRPQRGSLADAMAECVEVPTMAALRDLIAPAVLVEVQPYPSSEDNVDARIGWRTHMVVTALPNGQRSFAGFTNGVPP